MNLELFKEIINTIQKHEQWQDEVTDFLQKKICTGTYAFCTAGGDLVCMLLKILKEEFNDIDDWITWWIYEDVEKIVTYSDDRPARNLEDIKDFFEFLLENKAENEKVSPKTKEKSNKNKNTITLEEILDL